MIDFTNTIREIVEATIVDNEINRTYDNISTGLNIYGIKNKKFNIKDLFGFGDYNFILVQTYNEFYYLVDVNMTDSCCPINDDIFSEYLAFLGINNDQMTLNDIYFKHLGR
ncbi:MAG: hypothetical protein E7158_00800 [Firmicutes bacterium]|nr:hypothetical protein [Bacillota bacterium]